MPSLKRLARIVGLLYLVVGIFAGFAVAYVTAAVYVPGDAATTADKVLANAGLVRLGVHRPPRPRRPAGASCASA